MSGRHQPKNGADSAEALADVLKPGEFRVRGWDRFWERLEDELAPNFDDSGPADQWCDGCLKVSGLLTQVDGKLYCQKCEPLPTFGWTKRGEVA